MKAKGRSVWQNKVTDKWMYQVRVPQFSGKAKVLQRTAETKAEAIRLADQLYQELTKHSGSTKPVFIRELAANYFEIKKNLVKPSTLGNNKYLFEHYVLPLIGDRIAAKVTSVDVHNLLTTWKTDLSTATVNKLRSILNGVFSLAVEFRLVEFNPVQAVKPFRKPESEQTQVCKPWSIEEVREALEAFSGTPLDFFIHATLTLGLRKGEVLGLRWSDLNFEAGFIDIQNNRGSRRVIDSRGEIQTQMVSGSLKTQASRRRLALTGLVSASLLREKTRIESRGFEVSPEDYIVRGDSGKAISESSIRRIYNRVLRENGIRRIRIHDNRHTAAVNALEANVDLVKVAYGLGHGSPEITKRIYAPVVPHLSVAFSEGLARAIEGADTHLNIFENEGASVA